MFASPDVELDLSRFELRRAGHPVKLEKQPLELLILLVQRRGSLVTREEIAAHIWRNNNIHVDADQSIHSAVRKIRVALDDDPQEPRFIETVVGKGYRFTGPIRVIHGNATSPRRRFVTLALACALVISAASFVATNLRRSADEHAASNTAREAYLRGTYFFDKRTAEDVRKSIAYYRLAIRVDPRFALPRAGLAESLPAAANLSGESALPLFDEAIASARTAIDLDPNLGEAHAAYGWLLAIAHWNWRDARRELERAVQINPYSALAHQRYSMLLIANGEVDAAIREAARAHDLDPVSLLMSRNYAQTLFLARRYDDSLREFRRAEELDPRSPVTARCLDNIYEMLGKRDEAVNQDLHFLDREGVDRALIDDLREAWRARGSRGYWSRMLELPLPSIHRNAWVRAVVAARIGRTDDALKLLETAVDRHEVWATWLPVDPLFDGIRATPRFQHLLTRMNLRPG